MQLRFFLAGAAGLATLAAPEAMAKTYLCLPEVATALDQQENGTFSANVVDLSQFKFILTNESGRWLLKKSGTDGAIFDDCDTEYFCENSLGWAGAFYRLEGSKKFTIVFSWQKEQVYSLITAGGSCTEL